LCKDFADAKTTSFSALEKDDIPKIIRTGDKQEICLFNDMLIFV